MVVYVVTSGCYSDYDIEGIFLEKKKAEYFAKFHLNGYNGVKVQKFDTLDDDYVVNVRTIDYYLVKLSDKGEVYKIEKKQYLYDPNQKGMEFVNIETFHYRKLEGFVGQVIADSEEQAIKIMQDKRAEWLAEKYGV